MGWKYRWAAILLFAACSPDKSQKAAPKPVARDAGEERNVPTMATDAGVTAPSLPTGAADFAIPEPVLDD